MSQSKEDKAALQEAEYRLPIHWIRRKAGLRVYLKKTDHMAAMITQSGVSSGHALDLGCGDGRGTYELAVRLPNVTFYGVDFSERAIAFAKLMAPDIDFQVQDANGLSFPDNHFDLVVSREVIEHIPPTEINAYLGEIHRVLKPDGKLLITTPSTNRSLPEKHFQHFTAEQLQQLFEQAGFTVSSVVGFGWWPLPRFEKFYRYLIGLPTLWRIHAYWGGREVPIRFAAGLHIIGIKQ